MMLHPLYPCSTIKVWLLRQPVLIVEKMTKLSYTALGTAVSLETFGTKLVSLIMIFSLLTMLTFGSIVPLLAVEVRFSLHVFGGFGGTVT